MRVAAVVLLAALSIVGVHCSLPEPPPLPPERIAHGRFDSVTLYRTREEARAFVLLLSDASGWGAEDERLAHELVKRGALVAGVDLGKFIATMEQDGAGCQYASGDFENLARYVQGYAQLPGYYVPLISGRGDGAAMAWAMLAQGKKEAFAGAFTLGFCPELAMKKPLCGGDQLLTAATKQGAAFAPAPGWTKTWLDVPSATQACPADTAGKFGALPVADASDDETSNYVAAWKTFAAASVITATAPPELGKLPIVEVKSQGAGDTMAVLLSGDGGWAGIDKELAAALSAKGIPVAGFDSLRYFWTPREPAGLAADLERVLDYYPRHWNKRRVLLIGYSQGADVLPFAWNRFPEETKKKVGKLVLLGLGQKAAFEFHVGNWVSAVDDGKPIAPEASRLDAATALCLYGEDEKDSLCTSLPAGRVTALGLPGGHHFSGAYDKMAQLILDHSR